MYRLVGVELLSGLSPLEGWYAARMWSAENPQEA